MIALEVFTDAHWIAGNLLRIQLFAVSSASCIGCEAQNAGFTTVKPIIFFLGMGKMPLVFLLIFTLKKAAKWTAGKISYRQLRAFFGC